jgi:hypothetical protein
VTEWLGTGLQNQGRRFDSGRGLVAVRCGNLAGERWVLCRPSYRRTARIVTGAGDQRPSPPRQTTWGTPWFGDSDPLGQRPGVAAGLIYPQGVVAFGGDGESEPVVGGTAGEFPAGPGVADDLPQVAAFAVLNDVGSAGSVGAYSPGSVRGGEQVVGVVGACVADSDPGQVRDSDREP